MKNIISADRQAWSPIEAHERGLTAAITAVISLYSEPEYLAAYYRGASAALEALPAFSPAARDAAFTVIWIKTKAQERGITL